MPRGVNKVILVGNLGKDPEVRYSASGAAVANITLATTDSWKDKQSGEQQERTEWHRVVFFKRLGEVVGEYLKKGSQIYVEGSLKTSKWQDQSGQDRWTTEIVGSEMQMLGSRQGSGTPSNDTGMDQSAPPSGGSSGSGGGGQKAASDGGGAYDDFDDDIPF